MVGVVKADGAYEVAIDGSRSVKVIGTDANTRDVVWSADGTKVAFTEVDPAVRTPSNNPATNLRMADVAAGCWKALTAQGTDAFELPSLSPDGTQLAYIRHPNGSYMSDQPAYLEVMTNGGSVRRITATAWSRAVWAPDNSGRLVFGDREGLKLRKASGAVTILDPARDTEFPKWSPDSKKIAFSVSTNAAVWVVNADGTGLKSLTPTYQESGGRQVFWMSWFPDGTKIVYEGPSVVNSDGTNPHPVSNLDVGLPLSSRSGDLIAFPCLDGIGLSSSVDRTIGGAVMVFDVATGTAHEVAHDALLGGFFQPR